VRHLNVVNGVSSSQTIHNMAAASAERISLQLSVMTSSVVLNLTRNKIVNDKTPVYVANDGNVGRWAGAPANEVIHTF